MRRGVFRRIAVCAVFLLTVAGLVGVTSTTATAGTVQPFNAGYIISDANFFNYNSLTQAQIQSFLVAHETGCTTTATATCLKDFTQTTFDRAAVGTNHCGAYTGAANEPASQILFKAAQACKISPEVLLVTLEKEESLVTTAGTALTFRKAMGYGCPDTAPACDANYYGFYNQVYSAAWQFRQYTFQPVRTYKIGNVAISYGPGCASSVVTIQNQATANLYNYTPYQPSPAALAGIGGDCNSFGNLNFYKIYANWFGSPTGDIDPFGSVDSVTAVPGGVKVAGWAIDPDTADSIPVHVYVDGVGTAITADQPRPDVGAVYPAAGSNHGYSATIPVTTGGSHQVCIYGINIGPGANHLLTTCANVVTASGSPYGVIDSATASGGNIAVAGWAIDPDVADPLTVKLSVDGGTAVSTVGNGSRPDVAAAYPGYGPAHEYTFTAAAAPGSHQVCITLVNVGAGTDTTLPCRTVVIAGGSTSAFPDLGRPPFGVIDSVGETTSSVTVAGWAIDPDTSDPIQVHVYLDANGISVLANGPRPDVAAAYPGYGANHEYSATLTATPGTHDLCVYAINNSTKGPSNTQLTCHLISVPYPPGVMPDLGRAPFGVVDSVTTAPGSVSVAGWAIDPDTSDPIQVHVYLDAVGVALLANGARPDVAAAYPGYGPNHEYSTTMSTTSGVHDLCIYAINNSTNGPSNTQLTCHLITVP